MDFVTQEANVKLIKQIKLRPSLYNKNLPSYNRKGVQDKAWEDVAKRMGWQAAQCKERWRNLRCVYLRHIKKLSQGVQSRPYYLMKAMSFALPFVKPVNCDPLPKEMIEDLQRDDDKELGVNVDEEDGDRRKSLESHSTNRHVGSESPEPTPSLLTEFIPATSVEIKREEDALSNSSPPRNESFSQPKPRMDASYDFQMDVPDMSINVHKDLKTDARRMFLYSLLPDVFAMSDAQMRQFRVRVLHVVEEILYSDK